MPLALCQTRKPGSRHPALGPKTTREARLRKNVWERWLGLPTGCTGGLAVLCGPRLSIGKCIPQVSSSIPTGGNSPGLTPPQGQTLLFPGSTSASSGRAKPKARGGSLAHRFLCLGGYMPRGQAHLATGVWAASPHARKVCLNQLGPAPRHGSCHRVRASLPSPWGWDSGSLRGCPLSDQCRCGMGVNEQGTPRSPSDPSLACVNLTDRGLGGAEHPAPAL